MRPTTRPTMRQAKIAIIKHLRKQRKLMEERFRVNPFVPIYKLGSSIMDWVNDTIHNFKKNLDSGLLVLEPNERREYKEAIALRRRRNPNEKITVAGKGVNYDIDSHDLIVNKYVDLIWEKNGFSLSPRSDDRLKMIAASGLDRQKNAIVRLIKTYERLRAMYLNANYLRNPRQPKPGDWPHVAAKAITESEKEKRQAPFKNMRQPIKREMEIRLSKAAYLTMSQYMESVYNPKQFLDSHFVRVDYARGIARMLLGKNPGLRSSLQRGSGSLVRHGIPEFLRGAFESVLQQEKKIGIR